MAGFQEPEQADQVPEPQLQTEDAPPQEEVAAVEAQEEAAAEPVAEPTGPSQEQVAEWQRIQAEAYRQAQEDIRRENQIRNAQEARRKQNEAEAKEIALKSASLALYEQGFTDVPPEKITSVFDSYVKGRESYQSQRQLDDIANGFAIAAARVLGAPVPDDIPQTDEVLLRSKALEPYVQGLVQQAYNAARANLTASGEYVPAAVAPKVAKAAQAAQNAEEREGQQPYRTVQGESSPSGELTPATYAALTDSQRRTLQKTNPAAIDAMYAKYVTVPQKG